MSFSRAFFPVAITVLIALCAMIISLGITDNAIKNSDHKLSHNSMAQHIKNLEEFQATMVLDYAEWSETFTKLTINDDIEWFHYSIGGANFLNSRIHGLAFIKNDGTLVDQDTRNGNKSFAITQGDLDKNFIPIKKAILNNTALDAEPVSFFININGIPTLFSFSPITHPEKNAYPDFSMQQRDFLVFWTALTPELLSRASDILRLKELKVTSSNSPDNFLLKNSTGDNIAGLTWSLQEDGTNPLTLSFYTSLAMFALLLLGGYFSHRRIFSLIKELNQARKNAVSDDKVKSDFLATISHELRTPLNSIIGFSDILKSGAVDRLTEQQEEYVGHIQNSGKHLLTIINEILDMSKIESGKYELYEVEINLRQTLNQSIVFLEKDAQDKNITLIRKIPKPLNEFMGDEKVIRQLMLNLLSNSIKFTPDGGQITIGCSVTDGQEMEIYVEDNGIGISPKKINSITEPYIQDQDHKTRSHQGTGLGLAISKAFVELHQGTMTIQSELGKGTRVTLLFPASRVLEDML